jgi:tetratricopeptide (TPR) repeat protein
MKNLFSGLRAGLWLCLVLSFQMSVSGQQASKGSGATASQLTQQDAVRLTLQGRSISAGQAAKLEEKLAGEPQDLETRFTLIGYYSTRYDGSVRVKKREQALWVIRNIPDSELIRHVLFVRLNQHDEGFEEAKQLWLKQLDVYKGNPVVLSNAIDFFLIPDKDLAEKLLKQVAAAEPNNAEWSQRLGHLYLLQVTTATGQTRRNLAALASAQFELAYKLTSDDLGKRSLLIALAKSAIEAGEIERAHAWALQLLSQGATDKKDWNYGNAIHQGHIILGRIALLSGNLAEAREHLIAAGETPGSPQLNSFGPSMILAKELLEKGERDSVIRYFQLCANFWKNRSEMDTWTATVKGGGIPSFGANLAY